MIITEVKHIIKMNALSLQESFNTFISTFSKFFQHALFQVPTRKALVYLDFLFFYFKLLAMYSTVPTSVL
jgi:hypothetical protein